MLYPCCIAQCPGLSRTFRVAGVNRYPWVAQQSPDHRHVAFAGPSTARVGGTDQRGGAGLVTQWRGGTMVEEEGDELQVASCMSSGQGGRTTSAARKQYRYRGRCVAILRTKSG